jgi:GNAT superfamily N-acetyltransferase
MNKKVILPNLRAPKGFRFKIVEQYGSVKVQLFKNRKKVGHINMYKAYPYGKAEKLETHSWLHEDLRGKGIGTLLYSRAIEWALKNGYKVKSSGGSSEMAQRVWNSKGIRQHFRIRRIDRKNKGYFSDLWYAYAKPAPKKGGKHGQKAKRSVR